MHKHACLCICAWAFAIGDYSSVLTVNEGGGNPESGQGKVSAGSAFVKQQPLLSPVGSLEGSPLWRLQDGRQPSPHISRHGGDKESKNGQKSKCFEWR